MGALSLEACATLTGMELLVTTSAKVGMEAVMSNAERAMAYLVIVFLQIIEFWKFNGLTKR
jgi:hypothetical protein